MKKKIVLASIIALFGGVAIIGFSKSNNNNSFSALQQSEIEAAANCESVGWWDNDGNCVSNDAKEYFCKSDSWIEITDCKQ